MSVELNGKTWTTWADTEKELFTPEEIAESDRRVAAMCEAMEPERQIMRAISAHLSGLGLTEEQLAKASGISVAYLRRMEHGTANPSLRTLKRLAAGMGMKLNLEFVPLHPSGQ